MKSGTRATAAWIGAVVLAAGLGAWAGRATFTPPSADATVAAPVLHTVTEETVGRVQEFPVSATWSTTPLVVGAASGTVTSVKVKPGATVDAGDVLYTVDLRPTVVAQGAIPAFRELASGARGADVRQLETMLDATGHLAAGRVDDVFDAATTAAVRAWQKAAGYPVDGVVHLGDVAFAKSLPTRVVLDKEVRVGWPAPTGASVASALTEAPTFTIRLMADQQDLVPTSGAVTVTGPKDARWKGVIAGSKITDQGELLLTLEAADGGPLCAKDCADVPADEGTAIFSAAIVTVPEETGPAVPTSALQSDAAGSTFVEAPDGTRMPVTVRAQSRGLAVVDGVTVGSQVRLVASASS